MSKPFEWTTLEYYPQKYIAEYLYEDPDDKMVDFHDTKRLDTNFNYHLEYKAECLVEEL